MLKVTHHMQGINKKYLLFGGIAVIIIVSLLIYLYATTSGDPALTEEQTNITSNTGKRSNTPASASDLSPTPTITQNQSLGELVKQKLPAQLVEARLGRPTSTETKNDYTVLHYSNGSQESKIFIIDNKAAYSIEPIASNKSVAYLDYVANHSVDGILYNYQRNNEGYNLYIFAHDGLAFLASGANGNTVEIHRFNPLDYNKYFTLYAPKISSQ